MYPRPSWFARFAPKVSHVTGRPKALRQSYEKLAQEIPHHQARRGWKPSPRS